MLPSFSRKIGFLSISRECGLRADRPACGSCAYAAEALINDGTDRPACGSSAYAAEALINDGTDRPACG